MAPIQSSRLPGFYKLSIDERLEHAASVAGLDAKTKAAFQRLGGLEPDQADHMVENVIGVFGLPLGIATNFLINDRDILVPMAIEEPSVIAGASFMAKLAREGGGFHAETTEPLMIGQVQILDVPDLEAAKTKILEHRDEILAEADRVDPMILSLGGGARDIEVRILTETPVGPMLIVHLIYDTRDAMGANTINTAVERLSPTLESLSQGRTHLKILSNLADRRLAKVTCTVPTAALAFETFTGPSVRDGIVEAWAFAAADPYRAATHNKGIMNGVDAVVIATGNDWRAVEAGAHAYAARSGRYTSLSEWGVDEVGNLEGSLELPLAVGTVGGATRVHPLAKACLALMGVDSARELAQVIAAVGLAQNLAALRTLASEGIQRGHMSLHARQIAIAAGAVGGQIDRIAAKMITQGTIHINHARELLDQEPRET
ncbi:MAG: hydroxymethylglutaryl-CoA reductase, degradative [Anaerolineales bacterium]|nr:hydroxymethylglutaryl-CoA reductase, degradative [Anaerolineales bacterium]